MFIPTSIININKNTLKRGTLYIMWFPVSNKNSSFTPMRSISKTQTDINYLMYKDTKQVNLNKPGIILIIYNQNARNS